MALREIQTALDRIQSLAHVSGYVCMTSAGRAGAAVGARALLFFRASRCADSNDVRRRLHAKSRHPTAAVRRADQAHDSASRTEGARRAASEDQTARVSPSHGSSVHVHRRATARASEDAQRRVDHVELSDRDLMRRMEEVHKTLRKRVLRGNSRFAVEAIADAGLSGIHFVTQDHHAANQ